MTPADFRARAPEAIRALGEGTTPEVVKAVGGVISVHTAHLQLRGLEADKVIRRVGWRSRAIVWSLCEPPPG